MHKPQKHSSTNNMKSTGTTGTAGATTKSSGGERGEFNSIQFEKRLTGLKDSQESINSTSLWCLDNRQHHKQIVSTWLNVLKRVKVEQRLTLFYLANDVVQYSKRKSYEFVDSWSTALQKATTMVREDKVKDKIMRIFKIWEQRGVYSEEFVADLCGLISVSPQPRKNDEPHEFQSQYLITKIRNCVRLEKETDTKLTQYTSHNPALLDGSGGDICANLKDRTNKDDIEQELESFIGHMEVYVEALKSEIKSRNQLISLLLQAESQLDHDKKDVKVIATAYRTFATRVKTMQKKLTEMKSSLPSPIPSPDINAPSPSPDSDLEFPIKDSNSFSSNLADVQFSTPGFYNPLPMTTSTTETTPTKSLESNCFSSFLGNALPFNLKSMFSESNMNTSSAVTSQNSNTTSDSYPANNGTAPYAPSASTLSSLFNPPPPPATSLLTPTSEVNNLVYDPQSYIPVSTPLDSPASTPLAPPPLPLFAKNDYGYGNNQFDSSATLPGFGSHSDSAQQQQPQQAAQHYDATTMQNSQGYYNDLSNAWSESTPSDLPTPQETPNSPPDYERQSFINPTMEYHDGQHSSGAVDIDHRIHNLSADINEETRHKKDIDHRNLISLTGSPADVSNNGSQEWSKSDNEEYVPESTSIDQDYRIPPLVTTVSTTIVTQTPVVKTGRKDNTDDIDMELSDDDAHLIDDILKSERCQKPTRKPLLPPPPPPFPDFSDGGPPMLGQNPYPPAEDVNNPALPTDPTQPPAVATQSHPPPPPPPQQDDVHQQQPHAQHHHNQNHPHPHQQHAHRQHHQHQNFADQNWDSSTVAMLQQWSAGGAPPPPPPPPPPNPPSFGGAECNDGPALPMQMYPPHQQPQQQLQQQPHMHMHQHHNNPPSPGMNFHGGGGGRGRGGGGPGGPPNVFRGVRGGPNSFRPPWRGGGRGGGRGVVGMHPDHFEHDGGGPPMMMMDGGGCNGGDQMMMRGGGRGGGGDRGFRGGRRPFRGGPRGGARGNNFRPY